MRTTCWVLSHKTAIARLFDKGTKEAAEMIATDFSLAYDRNGKPPVLPKAREPTEKQKFEAEEKQCFRVLSDYFHKLRAWEKDYAPKKPEDEWHPLFVEALHRRDYIEYLLDILIDGTLEDRKALVAEQRNEVMKLEQRFHSAVPQHRRSPRKSGIDR